MKFQTRKIKNGQQNSLNSEFLTFRNYGSDPIEQTTRSIASHRLQYKSLQKYPLEFNQPYHHQNTLPHQNQDSISKTNSIQFRKSELKNDCKSILNVKSHQRLPKNIQQPYTKQNSRNFKKTNNSYIPPIFPNLEESSIQINPQSKNQVLNRKIDRIQKIMLRQNDKKCLLDAELEELQNSMNHDQEDYNEQQDNINQLQAIYRQNSKESEKIKYNLIVMIQRNKSLEEQLDCLNQQCSESRQSSKYQQDDKLENIQAKLNKKQTIHDFLHSKVEKLEKQINTMKQLIVNAEMCDRMFKKAILNDAKIDYQ